MMSEILSKHLHDLSVFFRQNYDSATWEKMLLVEDRSFLNETKYHVKRNDLFSPETYSARFEWLLLQGYGWINLQAAGVFHDTLLVVIETPNDSHKRLVNQTAINFSGPYKQAGRNDWDISNIVMVTD
jgi:hypothetical protein